MIFLDEIKDMKIYKKPFFAPINVDNKKKDSLVYLLTPNIESSKKLMTYPNMINRLYYQSYYLEKNVNYFIKSSLLENADNDEEYLREADSNYIEFLDYNNSYTEAVKSDIDDNFISGENINLNSLKKIKITKDVCNKLSGKYKYLKHIRISNNTEGYLFLDKSDELVCLISVETKENNQTWIQALEVDSNYKGHKLGTQLLDFAVKNLKANYLSVSKNNNVAFNMYIKYGFKTYKETDNMYFMSLKTNIKESTLSSKERKELSDSDFGLPNKRKYPIHDEKHVKSAIRFFNYVDKEDENELANNIIKRAKKFNMNISVGENNRLKKYLSEELSESYIKNDEDLYYNKDKFDRGEINLCFINGHMGSGKSTMGMDMLNNGIEWIELDAIIDNGYYTDEQAKNYSDLIYSFFKKYPKYRIVTNSSLVEAL